jgi:hypothetical protein
MTRGGYDVLLDKLTEKLQNYSNGAETSLKFEVKQDYNRIISTTQSGAYVIPRISSINPIAQRSGNGSHYAYDVSYQIDLIVAGKGQQGADYTRGDELAGLRLRLLIEQCFNALNPALDLDFGLPKNSIAKVMMPRVTFFTPEMQQGEKPIAGAQIQMDFSLVWNPEKLDGIDLDQISVNAGQIQALFEYTQE